MYDDLRSTGHQPPRLYGLAKVHKTDTPMRPVLSMPGSAYHKIGKQIATWLSEVPECQINTSTKKICDSLKDIKLRPDEELVSFDVSSLYTNVPVKEAIEVCANLLFEKHKIGLPVDKQTFMTLAEIATCNVLMSTHDGFYKQIDGLAMGSPPAPQLANATAGSANLMTSLKATRLSTSASWMTSSVQLQNRKVMENLRK